MNVGKWKVQHIELARTLKNQMLHDSYLKGKATVLESCCPANVPQPLNQKYCIACNQPIPHSLWMGKHRFCEQCIGTYNTLDDYRIAFQNIAAWMENFYTLVGDYPISIISNNLPFAAGRAIRVRKKMLLSPQGIICKGFMRRDAIEINMIYVYTELWLYEVLKDHNRRNILLRQYDDQSLKEIPYWYVALYLDWHGKTDQAKTMIRIKGLFRGKLRYRFVDTNLYDVRGELMRIMKRHPLAI